MGGKKKSNDIPVEIVSSANKQVEDEKKFVNLLPIYTIYKQKFRRLTPNEFETLLGDQKVAKKEAFKLCEEFMNAKNVPEDVSFERNMGFLSLPRFMPLLALIAERSDYGIKPHMVKLLNFGKTPFRFKEKFTYLMVYGFWFLGRVICDSLSTKEQVNRGNFFNFVKGDLGYWWAGVKILDWSLYVLDNRKHFVTFEIEDPPKYRFYSNRAIFNMNQHPIYFLSEHDWVNYRNTVKNIRHKYVKEPRVNRYATPEQYSSFASDFDSDSEFSSSCSNISYMTYSSEPSKNSVI